MKGLVFVVVVVLVAAGSAWGAARPVTKAQVVAAVEAKVKAVEVVRAARLPGRPPVACSAPSASSRSPVVVQCWAQASGGPIVHAVSTTVPCGLRGRPSCASAVACRYSVAVMAGSPLAAEGSFVVDVCRE